MIKVINLPTDILDCDLPSHNSGSSIRQDLNQHFKKWNQSQSHLVQPLNRNIPGKQSFDPKLKNNNFQEFVRNLKEKKQLILSGQLSEKSNKISQIPPSMKTNSEPDKEDFYWQAMIESEHIFPNHKLPKILDKSPKFTQDFLSQNLPEAPLLQPFDTIQEAVEL